MAAKANTYAGIGGDSFPAVVPVDDPNEIRICRRCHQKVAKPTFISAEEEVANKLRNKAAMRIHRLDAERRRLEEKARKKSEDKEYLQHCTTQFINYPTDANELLMHRALLV